MMLHRHFSVEKSENITTTADLFQIKKEEEDFVSDIFRPDEEQPKRRGRPKKAKTEE